MKRLFVLTLAMLIVINISSFNTSYASEDYYLYKKYNMEYTPWGPEVMSQRSHIVDDYANVNGHGMIGNYVYSSPGPVWGGNEYKHVTLPTNSDAGWLINNSELISYREYLHVTHYGYVEDRYDKDGYLLTQYRKSYTKYTRTRSGFKGNYVSDIIVKDGEYPNNGVHEDGYWYVKDKIINMDNLGPVDIKSLSDDLKKDITPSITVVKGKEFIEVVSGRGYMGNLAKYTSGSNSYILTRNSINYVTLRGTFNTLGVNYTTLTDSLGNKATFLFNVIDDPAHGSARGVKF